MKAREICADDVAANVSIARPACMDQPLRYAVDDERDEPEEAGVPGGLARIAERILQSLEAADPSVAALPGRATGAVLLALGSSALESEELARQMSRLFRDQMLSAVETNARRALHYFGNSPHQ